MSKEQATEILGKLRNLIEDPKTKVLQVRLGQNRKALDYVYPTENDRVPEVDPHNNKLEYIFVVEIERQC